MASEYKPPFYYVNIDGIDDFPEGLDPEITGIKGLLVNIFWRAFADLSSPDSRDRNNAEMFFEGSVKYHPRSFTFTQIIEELDLVPSKNKILEKVKEIRAEFQSLNPKPDVPLKRPIRLSRRTAKALIRPKA